MLETLGIMYVHSARKHITVYNLFLHFNAEVNKVFMILILRIYIQDFRLQYVMLKIDWSIIARQETGFWN